MTMDVRGVHLELTGAILQYVREHLGHALSAHEGRLHDVSVRLSDENGHKKQGPDKRCLVRIDFRGRAQTRPVIIDERHGDLYAAIDGAAQRAKRTVRQQITRRRDTRRFAA